MRSLSARERSMLRAIGAGALLSIGLSGCYGAEGGVPEAFCGYLYYCGNHGGSDNDGPPPDADPPSSSPATAAAGEETGDTSSSPTAD